METKEPTKMLPIQGSALAARLNIEAQIIDR